MKSLCVWLMLCGVAVASEEDDKQRARSERLLDNVRGYSNSIGSVTVKYHEQFGPYKLWEYVEGGGVHKFEARFVGIKNGQVVFGVDGTSTEITKARQTVMFTMPLSRFHYITQQEMKKEVAKRTKAEKDKKVLYPEPPPEAKAEVVNAKEAPKPARKEPARFGGSYRRINGKLVPVEIPMNDAAREQVAKELEKQKAAEKKEPAKKP